MTNSRPPAELEALSPVDTDAGTVRDGPSRPCRFCSPWFAILLLIAVVLASYANSLQCPFVFDDYADIVLNPSIRHLWPLENVLFDRSKIAAGLRSRPAVNLSFALDYAIGGLNTLPYHVTNLLIHMLAGLALFGIVRRTLMLPALRDRFGRASTALALAVALLWSVQPLQTESVTFIIQRCESMMGLFYLLAIYSLIHCGDSTNPYRWGAATAAAALLSLGCKEVAVSLPIMILLFDRVLLAGSFGKIWRRRWGLYLALLIDWAAFAVLQLHAGPAPGTGAASPVSWFVYARSQPGVILHYLRLAFWPHPLVLDYNWPPARTIGEILPGSLVVTALLAATAYAVWKRSAWGLVGAWFFLILAPTSSVMPLADLAFEHRMYLPLAAVVTAIVLGGYVLGKALVRRDVITTRAATVIGGCLVAAASLTLGYLTCRRNQVYRSPLALWQDTVDNRPNNYRARNNLGNVLDDRGQFEAAVAEYHSALEIKPDYVEAHYNLALALANHGRPDQASGSFQTALDLATAANNIALAELIRTKMRHHPPAGHASKRPRS